MFQKAGGSSCVVLVAVFSKLFKTVESQCLFHPVWFSIGKEKAQMIKPTE